MKALILTADAFEEAELLVPYYRLREEGIPVDVAAPRSGRLRGEHGYPFQADKAFAEIGSLGHDLLIVPGGRAAEALAEDRAAVRIATWFLEEKHTVAAICHGPLVLVATGLMEEREMTGHPSIAFALRAARVRYVDQEVATDGDVVTSRRPADLPAFMRELMRRLHPRRGPAGA